MLGKKRDVFSVQDKVVLITGAGRGIGRGIVRVLADNGAKVAVNALTDQAAGPLVKEITESSGDAWLVLGDLTQSSEAASIVEQTVQHYGKIDVLVNNLGDSISKPLTNEGEQVGMTDDDWKFIVDMNLTHMFYCCRAAGSYMQSQGHGKVINISSFASARGGGGVTAYATAKTGVIGLTRALALEWAPHIQVNAIAPGVFPDSEELTAEEQQLRDQQVRERVPLQRVGRPYEVGYLAQYLASAASNYMTGQTIYLDGGQTIK